jgi:protein-S-isoprenylcysteine O-methyltransferase Ste14
MPRRPEFTWTFGLGSLASNLKRKRERYRQILGIALLLVLTLLGAPLQMLWVWGSALVVLGELVRLWASGHVKKDKLLATGGPYAFVRHPLYVGNFLISMGICLASGLWWSAPVMILFWLAFYPPAIRSEDSKLHRLFGASWEEWSRVTRALIPRARPYPGAQGGRWSFGQSLRQNGEPIIAAVLGLCLWWLYVQIG